MIGMLFRWLKKKEAVTKEGHESHFPVKVLIEPDSKNESLQATGKEVVTPDFILESSQYDTAGQLQTSELPLYSRCGFNTCNELETHEKNRHRKDAQKGARSDAQLRNEILNADDLEECLKIIEKKADRKPAVAARKYFDTFDEPRKAESCDKYTIWGNRLPS
jgi:hypothetical protein